MLIARPIGPEDQWLAHSIGGIRLPGVRRAGQRSRPRAAARRPDWRRTRRGCFRPGHLGGPAFRRFRPGKNAQPAASGMATIANSGRLANMHSKVSTMQKSPTQSVQTIRFTSPVARRRLAQRTLSMRRLHVCVQRRKSPARFDSDPVKVLGGATDLFGADKPDCVAFVQHPDVVAERAEILLESLADRLTRADFLLRSPSISRRICRRIGCPRALKRSFFFFLRPASVLQSGRIKWCGKARRQSTPRRTLPRAGRQRWPSALERSTQSEGGSPASSSTLPSRASIVAGSIGAGRAC